MYKINRLCVFAGVALLVVARSAVAQPIQQDTPIEISSDTLDVFQNENRAVFSGNVIAVQGQTRMRGKQMVVFYRDSASSGTTTTAAPPATPQGIYRIEALGEVVFTTPTESALGDKAIYNVDTDTIDLFGADLTLTRGQNVLKGNHLNYQMATGRSVLTGGASGVAGKPARVHGLFVPKSEPKSQPGGRP